MTNLYVFDLDGTMADISHRLHYIKSSKPGYSVKPHWKEFFEACVDDKPIAWTIDLFKVLYEASSYQYNERLILTGRSEVVRDQTDKWLIHNGIFYDYLIMRPEKNYQPDDILKPKLLEDFLRGKDFNVQFIVEDRQKVVNKWRQLGYHVLQCDAWEETK